ncbi:hypothetical protein [Catellatospora tritici]|uniref:hypothetical protein n=1 Tax=Catellatospora tritici TaxID=2851566 RepID=UPI001C2CDD92|nr:hypothetical protein [Catellatospora tritici]MBV1849004.1 hypothetical protein [Catellatospora tritici]
MTDDDVDDEARTEAPRGYEGNHVADGEVVDVDAAPTRPEARGDEAIELEERDGVYVPTDSTGSEDETEDDGLDDEDRRGEFRPETDEAAPLSEHLDDETDPEAEPVDDRATVTATGDTMPLPVDDADETEAAEQTLSDAEVAAAAGAATLAQAADSPAIGVAAVPTVDDARTQAATLWADGTADELRERWEALQLRFVDDPAAVAAELRDLVEETLRTLQDALAREHAELDGLVETAGTDTELLRQAVQRHRDFHQRLLAL